MIDDLEEVANSVFVDGGGAVKSIVNAALTAFGTFGAVVTLVSESLLVWTLEIS